MASIMNQIHAEKNPNKNISLNSSLYNKSTIHATLHIPYNIVGNDIKDVILSKLQHLYEGRCIKEGYVKPDSIKLLQYSSGMCREDKIIFNVVYQAYLCYPIEGMKIVIRITNITKAGIRGKSRDESSPIDVFVARDHNMLENYMETYKVGDTIYVEIIGQRYEINDTTISIIAELLEDKSKLNIKDNSGE